MTDAEKALRVLLDKVLKERRYEPSEIKIQEMSSGGRNYTSALFLISICLPEKELKLFAKVANIGKELRNIMQADWLYGTERFVYTRLMHLYNELQKDLKDEYRYVFPEFYGISEETGKETVIMENLVESGYEEYDRFKSLDWDHGRIGVETLAKFHALSFALDKSDPETFKKITANMIYRIGGEEETQSSKNIWIKNDLIERSLSVLDEGDRAAVRKLIVNSNSMSVFNKPINKPVISHGDYRLSNMLFKGQGDELKVRVVDYQTVHAGCAVTDLVYFIYLSSDEEFLRLYFDKLANHYYTSLEAALKRLSVDPVEVYPREQFERDLKEKLPYAVLAGVLLLPVIIADEESAPKLNNDLADISTFIVKTNDLFAERLRGIVSDCIRRGVL
ncbi:uncharacterized protein LOC116771725 isoform X1 [Danaus plexippus]|uniref:uncharacterized protein LOC116771725 isoform X1 n=1 Tax=Danaus plexippus TaxID=13037 RepID=UPI002AB19C34|nr:uncharacterized protein LOC116771725 isoform X1 [Danaus plexippus]